MRVRAIALPTGLSDHNHLMREFAIVRHTTPGAYRRPGQIAFYRSPYRSGWLRADFSKEELGLPPQGFQISQCFRDLIGGFPGFVFDEVVFDLGSFGGF